VRRRRSLQPNGDVFTTGDKADRASDGVPPLPPYCDRVVRRLTWPVADPEKIRWWGVRSGSVADTWNGASGATLLLSIRTFLNHKNAGALVHHGIGQ